MHDILIQRYFVIFILSNLFLWSLYMSNILSLDAFDKALMKKGWDLSTLAKQYDQKYPNPDGKSVYNTLRKWRGTTGNPTLKILVRICNLLDCDVDYLLGRIEEHTHEKKIISQETGLSEDSIDVLKRWKKIGDLPGESYIWARNSIRAINDLLEQDIWFARNVLNEIANYCYYQNLYNTKNISDKERTKAFNNFRLALFNASNGFMDCVKAIYKKQAKTPDTN